MFNIRIADIGVTINNKYDYVQKLCKDYIVDNSITSDMSVEVSDELIDEELAAASGDISRAYAESICIYRDICQRLPVEFNAYLFHSAVIEFEGNGYAFSAKSGTGKSTHIALWRKHFGPGVHIINGDKPILRFIDGELYAFGTPWCGKEGWQSNSSVKLKALCFLERDLENSIRQISASDAIVKIFHQILMPEDIVTVDALIPLLDRTLRTVPCYVLSCNISPEAAQIAYDEMSRENTVEVIE